MKRLLFFILAILVLGATLTGCVAYPYPIDGSVIIAPHGHHHGHHNHDDDED